MSGGAKTTASALKIGDTREQVLVEKLLELPLEALHVAAAIPDDLGHLIVMQQCVEHVLQRQVLVAAPCGFLHR